MIESASTIKSEILDFIGRNNVATVCGSKLNEPHCFSCFYTFLRDEACLVFKSSADTIHMQMLLKNNHVAGTITPADISMTKIQGVQFKGILVEKETIGLKASRSYYMHYPFAVTVPGKTWVLELQEIKFTSTINGIKNKMEWQRMKESNHVQ